MEYLILIGAGMLAITLHAKLRYPLNIPGHHGIEFMIILVFIKKLSSVKYAGTISSLGIGLFFLFPVLGFRDPLMGLHYMLPGIAIDLLYNRVKSFKYIDFVLPAIAGLAYMLIPFSRLIIHFSTGYIYQSFLKHGYITPVLLFLLFGFIGGIIGTGLSPLFKKH